MREEHQLQVSCVNWFRIQYPSKVLIAIPNGGVRDVITGKMLKAEGVVAGAPDLLLFEPNANYHGLCIEMKTPKGRQSDVQLAFQWKIEQQGYAYVICRTFFEFVATIETYLQNRL